MNFWPSRVATGRKCGLPRLECVIIEQERWGGGARARGRGGFISPNATMRNPIDIYMRASFSTAASRSPLCFLKDFFVLVQFAASRYGWRKWPRQVQRLRLGKEGEIHTFKVLIHTVWYLHFFVQKFSFDIPRKIVQLFWVKTRENAAVLDFLAVDNFDFTRKIVKKNLGQKLVKMLGICTF